MVISKLLANLWRAVCASSKCIILDEKNLTVCCQFWLSFLLITHERRVRSFPEPSARFPWRFGQVSSGAGPAGSSGPVIN